MSKLIALVATAVVVNGERLVIQPGEPLPELSEHDTQALAKSGAALDQAEQDSRERKAVDLEAGAQQEFQEARQRALSEAASIATPQVEQTQQTDQVEQVDQVEQRQASPARKTAAKKS